MFFVIRLRRIILALILVVLMIYVCTYFYPIIHETIALPSTNKLIVIDAGHGGFDPGAIGVTGKEEKTINLAIALKLQALLEQSGANVVLTRATDEAVAQSKKEDMKVRKIIKDESDGDIFISIHLNSFPEEKYKGAQVFYPKGNEESKIMAENIQKSLINILDKGNNRIAKELKDIYLIKNSKIPSNIVECGFVSNSEEEAKLSTSEYQDKIAWAIYIGLTEYLLGNAR